MLESPRIGRREILLLSAGSVVLALLMHWPLPLHMGSRFARDLGDPIVQAWQVAWGGHALVHQPFEFFQSNQYWPLKDTLAFSDALIGYAPAGVIGHGVEAATVRYNALFLFAYALATAGAYLLVREFGLRPAAAAIGGVAFAYAPWRLEQDGHLHVLSSGGIPLTLFLLLRGYRRDNYKLVFAGWLVALWQVSIGFTLGLQLGYLLAFVGVCTLIWWWPRRTKLKPARGVVRATVAGAAILAVGAVLLSLPYQRVLSDHPEAERSLDRVAGGSSSLWMYVSAPENNSLWGGATEQIRKDHLNSVAEQTLFPGVAIFLLVIAGLAAPVLSKRWRIGMGAAALGLILLSFGVRASGAGSWLPYRLLYEFAPGWQGVRTPGRINTLTSLVFALLAAAGTQWLIGAISKKTAARAVPVLASAAVVAVICLEFAGNVTPKAPPEPVGATPIAAPQLHLPITIAANRRYVYWSTDGFPDIVNGRSSVDPTSFSLLKEEVSDFPDRRSVDALTRLGVRSVVLHPYLLVGTRWHDAAEKPIAGLGITRRRQGDLIIYSLAN